MHNTYFFLLTASLRIYVNFCADEFYSVNILNIFLQVQISYFIYSVIAVTICCYMKN